MAIFIGFATDRLPTVVQSRFHFFEGIFHALLRVIENLLNRVAWDSPIK